MEKIQLGPETLLYPTPAVLVGAVVQGKPNWMTAAWCGIASSKPPAISVAIRPSRHTYAGLIVTECFSINIPSVELAEKVDYCGIYSGAREDKSQLFECFYGQLEQAPMISQCPLNLECRLRHNLDLGAHRLIIGEIVETYLNADCMTDGKPDPTRVNPLIYCIGSMAYHGLGERVGRAFALGKKKS
jgi:flavin reductase (DIM6/NTAB) family NADH-FMN oxidoreductase RutF